MALVHTSLFCHAPIVIPAVGGARGASCARTTAAMQELAAQVVAARPDAVLVLSPHTPRIARAVPMVVGPLRVDFADFGAALAFELPPIADTRGLIACARAAGVLIEPMRRLPLDHGAGVPLAFLYAAGWRGPTAVLGLPWDDDLHAAQQLGRALHAWAHGVRVAVVASGDGSHRLKPGAPAGFHPEAQRFDDTVRAALEARDDAALRAVDPALRELAAEDVLSSVVAATTAAGHARGRRVLSYEGPFGVGYTVAVLDDPRSALGALDAPPEELLGLARASVKAHFRGEAPPSSTAHDDARAFGVMVSWHNAHDDALRGCLGHVPERAPLGRAVASLAVLAATQDPRFEAVRERELDQLRCTVTLVGEPEPVPALDALDPKQWGVTVRLGHRHGLLLPDLEGVDTAEEQLRIVLRKAGIASHEPYELRRFRAASATEGRP